MYWIFIPAVILGTFRGILTLFEMFTPTRTLVRMMLYVLYDLIPFLVILMGYVFVFATIFISMEREGEEFIA